MKNARRCTVTRMPCGTRSLGRPRWGIGPDAQAQGRVRTRGRKSHTSSRTRSREREIGDIIARLLELRPDSLRVKLRDIRSFVVRHMRDLREIVNSDAAKTRAIFAKHIERITLTPTGEHYLASGTWDLVGRGSIDGAGGPACTTRRIEFQVSLAA